MKNSMWILMALTTAVLAGCGTTSTPSTVNNAAQLAPQTSPASSANTQTLQTQSVALTVLPGGRLGPDGKMHDTVTNPNFTVVADVPVTVTVYNYDGGAHSISNGDLKLNLQAKASPGKGVPSVTSVTFTPNQTGDFTWMCLDACDGQNGAWAMSHVGYMKGVIHVVPFSDKQYIYLTIKDGLQYAAADGKLHDSFSPADFKVKAGIPVQVTIENFDSGKHSLTSSDLGLNQIVQGAPKEGTPSITTFTFTPTKAGAFHWMCTIPCDGNGWAMAHDGYMAGNITVTE